MEERPGERCCCCCAWSTLSSRVATAPPAFSSSCSCCSRSFQAISGREHAVEGGHAVSDELVFGWENEEEREKERRKSELDEREKTMIERKTMKEDKKLPSLFLSLS